MLSVATVAKSSARLKLIIGEAVEIGLTIKDFADKKYKNSKFDKPTQEKLEEYEMTMQAWTSKRKRLIANYKDEVKKPFNVEWLIAYPLTNPELDHLKIVKFKKLHNRLPEIGELEDEEAKIAQSKKTKRKGATSAHSSLQKKRKINTKELVEEEITTDEQNISDEVEHEGDEEKLTDEQENIVHECFDDVVAELRDKLGDLSKLKRLIDFKYLAVEVYNKRKNKEDYYF